jgi:hypothetical protein
MDHGHVEDAFPESFDDLPDDLRELLGPFHIEEMYHVTGATYADNLRHGCARVELLNCLDEDPQVLAHLETWGREIGLIQAAEEAARLGEEEAELCGVRGRWEIWRREEHEPLGPPDEARDQVLSERLTQAMERVLEAFRRNTEVFEAACAYVRDELQLPWIWLAWELSNMLLLDEFQYVFGIELRKGLRFIPEDPPAADFSWTFAKRPGETFRSMQQRFIEESNQAYAQIQPASGDVVDVPTGRLRKDLEETTRRYTRWFYRHRFCQENPYQIAKTHHAERDQAHQQQPFPKCSCLRNVLDGIKEAERVLGLTPYFFRPSSEE